MAKPAKPAAAKKEEPVAEQPKSNKKMLIIAVAVAALVAGGAGWYFMKGKTSGEHEAPKVEVAKDPIFIPLEAFTVNLQREEADQYLQVTFSLKVMEPELVDKIKAVLPEIRSKLNLLLSSKRPSELSTIEGKKKLAAEIVVETNGVLGIHNKPATPAPVAASAPAAVPEVVAASAPAVEGEAPVEAAAEHAGEHGEQAAAEGAAPAPAPAPAAPAAPEKKGVVDVMFTSFIIQ